MVAVLTSGWLWEIYDPEPRHLRFKDRLVQRFVLLAAAWRKLGHLVLEATPWAFQCLSAVLGSVCLFPRPVGVILGGLSSWAGPLWYPAILGSESAGRVRGTGPPPCIAGRSSAYSLVVVFRG